jgi:hypothetical protein
MSQSVRTLHYFACSLLILKEEGVLQKMQKTLFAPVKLQESDQSATVDGWVSVEMQHLMPILTALGAGFGLGAACLLLERGARLWVGGKQRVRPHQKTASNFFIYMKEF